jgi:hypothetical protein
VPAIGRSHAKATLAARANAVLLHGSLHTLLGNAHAALGQLAPDGCHRPPIRAACLGVHSAYAPLTPRRSCGDVEEFARPACGVGDSLWR